MDWLNVKFKPLLSIVQMDTGTPKRDLKCIVIINDALKNKKNSKLSSESSLHF